jgi:hypothetical protein
MPRPLGSARKGLWLALPKSGRGVNTPRSTAQRAAPSDSSSGVLTRFSVVMAGLILACPGHDAE